jgi:hypothetical protein
MLYEHYDHCFDYKPSTIFIETLIANPALALLVKGMKEIGSVEFGIDEPNLKPRIRSFRSIRAICSKIEALSIPQGERYVALLREGNDSFYGLETALILYLSPNIETVAFNCCPEARTNNIPQQDIAFAQRQPQAALLPLMHASQRIPYGHVHPFTRLKSLKIRMQGLHVNSLSPVLRLDSLRDLVLFDYSQQEDSLNDVPCELDCPPISSTIQNIRLFDFECHLESLKKNPLLSSCKALKSFAWTTPFTDKDPPYQWPNIKTLLQTLQPGLEALKIKENRKVDEAHPRLGSLRNLTNLRYLAVPLELIVGMRISLLIIPSLTLPRPCRSK